VRFIYTNVINLLLTQRAARPNAEQFSLCVADRLVLTFCFFFVKEKESIKNCGKQSIAKHAAKSLKIKTMS
jgi:hypothetical protein